MFHFLSLATVNNAAMDVHVYSMHSFFLGLYLGVKLSIIPVISALRGLRQDCHELKASLDSRRNLRLAWATC